MKQRRHFLKIVGTFSFTAILNCLLGSWLRPVWAGEGKVAVPREAPMESLAFSNPAELDTSNLEITPLQNFKTMGSKDFKADPEAWRLEISGRVKNPLSISYSQVLELPSLERPVLLICPGVFANNGLWKGISLKVLLERAGMDSNATRLTLNSPEGDHASREQFSVEEVLAERVFLAYGVNGQTLPEKHGFPLRVVAEGHFGSKWIKYVCCVTVE